MFGFANALLLALFAAAVVDLAGMVWQKRSLPAALKTLWKEEHLLFGGWGGGWRTGAGAAAFAAGLAAYEGSVVFCNSMAR